MLRLALARPHRLYNGFIKSARPPFRITPRRHLSTGRMKSAFTSLEIYPTLIYWIPRLLIAVPVFHIVGEYFCSVVPAYGISMLPTIASSGDWLLLSRYYKHGRGVGVGDVVSFYHPVNEGERAVKRIIGMPGDFVERDTPGTSGVMVQVPAGHCWIVGDNLTWSRDSRMFGALPLALVNGKVIGRLRFAFSRDAFKMIEHGLSPASDLEEVD